MGWKSTSSRNLSSKKVNMKTIYFRFVWLFLVLLIVVGCVSKSTISSSETQSVDSKQYFISGKNFSHFDIDQFGNIFIVSNNRNISKYNPDGTLDKTYDSQSGGFIHSIDVNNALYILVFYRDAAKLLLLDRNLAPLQELSISSWTTDDITAAQLSNDNNIWLYDNTNRNLIKYSIEGKKILESPNLYGITALNTYVEHIYEHENKVFLRNQEGGLIVLNNLGAYLKDMEYVSQLPLTGRKKQLCFSMDQYYSCARLDDNPFQQLIPIQKIENESLESTLYKLDFYQLFKDGLSKQAISK